MAKFEPCNKCKDTVSLYWCEDCIRGFFNHAGSLQQAKAQRVVLNDWLVLRQLLKDIAEQATRKNRACSLKEYLVRDLELIDKLAQEAITEFDKLSAH